MPLNDNKHGHMLGGHSHVSHWSYITSWLHWFNTSVCRLQIVLKVYFKSLWQNPWSFHWSKWRAFAGIFEECNLDIYAAYSFRVCGNILVGSCSCKNRFLVQNVYSGYIGIGIYRHKIWWDDGDVKTTFVSKSLWSEVAWTAIYIYRSVRGAHDTHALGAVLRPITLGDLMGLYTRPNLWHLACAYYHQKFKGYIGHNLRCLVVDVMEAEVLIKEIMDKRYGLSAVANHLKLITTSL